MKINMYGDMNFLFSTEKVAPNVECCADIDTAPEVEMEQPEPENEDEGGKENVLANLKRSKAFNYGVNYCLGMMQLASGIYDTWLFSCVDVDDDVDDVPDESDKPDDDKIAMLLMPGEKPEVMKWAEVCELLPDFDEKTDRMNCFTDAGLVLYYRPDQVITFGDKEFLLGAAAVVCEDDDYNLVSMDGKEIYEVFQYAEDCTTTLCCNDRDFPALALSE